MARAVDSEFALTLERVEGQLTWQGDSCFIGWRLTVDKAGKVELLFDAVDVNADTAWMLRVFSARELFAPWGLIRGRTTDGAVSVESDHIVIGVRHLKGRQVQLEADAVQIRLRYLDSPTTASGCRVMYFPLGMRGFAAQKADTQAGRITLAGSQVDDFNLLAGRIQIDAPAEGGPFEGWLSACDDVTRQVLDLVSLADGRFISWSAKEVSEAATTGRVVYRDFFGPRPSGRPWDEVFDWLNLQPVLDLALHSYTPELRAATGMEIAIGWFVTHPSHTELQLLVACSALEHMVSVYLQQTQSEKPTILPPEVFDAFHETARDVLETTCAQRVNEAALQRVRSGLGQLNQGSLRDNLTAMLAAYRVPLSGIEAEIPAAIQARNEVVHRGTYSQYGDVHLYSHVAVLRELLKRIFLKLLGFEGVYHSLLQGPRLVNFPSLSPAT